MGTMTSPTTRRNISSKQSSTTPSTTKGTTTIVTEATTTIPITVASRDDSEDITEYSDGEHDDDLKSKYVKLVEHNSKLVDLLKTTMQIQTDMFRKLIHYVFP